MEDEADVFRIAQAMMDENIPIRFTSALLLSRDVESLKALAQSKSYSLKVNLPTIEISYG